MQKRIVLVGILCFFVAMSSNIKAMNESRVHCEKHEIAHSSIQRVQKKFLHVLNKVHCVSASVCNKIKSCVAKLVPSGRQAIMLVFCMMVIYKLNSMYKVDGVPLHDEVSGVRGITRMDDGWCFDIELSCVGNIAKRVALCVQDNVFDSVAKLAGKFFDANCCFQIPFEKFYFLNPWAIEASKCLTFIDAQEEGFIALCGEDLTLYEDGLVC